jgi:hypothetical protein
MDTHLLQLERELFSLTPVEAPRRFVSQLEREVSVPAGPVPVARRTAASAPRVIVPFRWQRIVVPAAAAVVVVSVLNRQGHNGAFAPALTDAVPNEARSSTPQRAFSSPASAALRSRPINSGYMMMTEQSPLQSVNLSTSPNQYWVAPSQEPQQQYAPAVTTTGTRMVMPRRETVPFSFH